MFNLFNKSDKIEAFWIWFKKNKVQYEDLAVYRDEKMDDLLTELHKIQDGLSFEISNEYDGFHEIIISAEGDIDKFPIVKEIVAKAPELDGWKPIAFRQPMTDDFTLEYEDLRLTPSQLFFTPIIEENALDIIIFGEDFKDYAKDVLAHYGLILLDNVMGEFNCVTKVRHYDFQDLDEAEEDDELIPLIELNKFIDQFYMSRN